MFVVMFLLLLLVGTGASVLLGFGADSRRAGPSYPGLGDRCD
jgi:hypothetical protein